MHQNQQKNHLVLWIIGVYVLPDLVLMETTIWVWIRFHLDKFDDNRVEPGSNVIAF